YRVNHHDIAALHAALAEVGILYATARVHTGWYEPGDDGVIPWRPDRVGGHAFAIVGYDERGFWIQNSWGAGWGQGGLALVTYDDWFENAMDVWVARLGAPVALAREAVAAGISAQGNLAGGYAYADLRPHIVSVGNDGRFREGGTFGTTPAEAAEIVRTEIPRLTAGWDRKRILLYAHGGLVSEKAAIQRVAEYRAALLGARVYPLAFVWKTDAWTTIRNILDDALGRRRPEGVWDEAKDFLLDRLDDGLEPLARVLGGKALWDEMKENALRATTRRDGAARRVGELLAELADADPTVELHLVGHSAGSIFLGPLVRWLTARGTIASGPLAGRTGLGLRIASCTLWAPACTVDLFKALYLPALRDGAVGRFALFTLTDEAEQDDHCAHIYHKSLLYLV
ncbi:MAG: peptidase C1, partial [Candidatus Dadabacteria bacterium]